jgi:hypothetical protein
MNKPRPENYQSGVCMRVLFCFFMLGVLLAEFAHLAELQTIFQSLFIFPCKIVCMLAFLAFHFD